MLKPGKTNNVTGKLVMIRVFLLSKHRDPVQSMSVHTYTSLYVCIYV